MPKNNNDLNKAFKIVTKTKYKNYAKDTSILYPNGQYNSTYFHEIQQFRELKTIERTDMFAQIRCLQTDFQQLEGETRSVCSTDHEYSKF